MESNHRTLPTRPDSQTANTLGEKIRRSRNRNRKRFWTKIALLILAILIPIIILVVCLATLLPRRSSASTSKARAITRLDYGAYAGTRLGASGVDQYMGIRFAAPPTGNNRWRAPQPPQSFTGVQNATVAQPVCLGVGGGLIASQSEDCLFMNIFTPSNATSSSKLPVWVYIQGGGYSGDDNANYNGTQVVQAGNVVQVNFNYRVGSWGFLASELVRADGDLNAGLLDQRLALNWTRNYISQFGGDPNHIVVHGASAGAGSVGHHLIAYGGRNDSLFVGAIAQSPFFQTEMTVAALEWQFDLYASQTNCNGSSDPMSCLRSQNVTTLQLADYSSPFPGHHEKPRHAWGPTIDGDLIPDYPMSMFYKGQVLNVPLLVGDEPDEGTLFAPNASTSSDVQEFFNENYPKLNATQLKNITSQYPKGGSTPDHAAYFGAAAQAYGESTLICPGIWMCQAMSAKNASRVWNYSFNVSVTEDWANGLGAFHTIDTGAIFGPNYAGPPSTASASAYSTSNKDVVPVMMGYYLSFVKTLDPNTLKSSSAPDFGTFRQGNSQNRLKIEVASSQMEDIPGSLVDNCQFWKGLQTTMET